MKFEKYLRNCGKLKQNSRKINKRKMAQQFEIKLEGQSRHLDGVPGRPDRLPKQPVKTTT